MPRHSYRYAFGDEAGDPGFAFDRGSTRYFVALLLLLDDPEPLRHRVDRLRQQLGLPSHVEFKFHKTSDANRRAFLAALRPHPFVGRALVIDKSRLPAEWCRMRDVEFYASCFAELITQVPTGELGGTILVLDQYGAPKTTLRELRRRLKTLGVGQVPRPFKKISLKRSKGENLIQCADMVVGALMRELSEGDSSFFDLVRDKVVVWEFQTNKNLPS
ncbi:MAG: DUF3800 domain-containing protein [Anaerolineae bacterium]